MEAIEVENMDHQTEYHGKRLSIRFNIGDSKTNVL